MYGYVVVNKPELKFREFDVYRSYYCGLCKILGEKYGVSGRISLSYDMTFLIMLLSGLYEPKTEYSEERCIVHPASKHPVRYNEVTDYVADMNILMMYYKCVDDWKDEHKFTRKILADSYHKRVDKIIEKHGRKADLIRGMLDRLAVLESDNSSDIDKVSRCFGEILSAVTAWRDDEWQENLSKLGFFLGKYIYILDAYDDLQTDIKKNNYNMLKVYAQNSGFDEFVEGILNGVMAECARYFERLPIIQDAEILRNIIYSRVWTRYEIAKHKRQKEDQSK